MSLSTCLRSPGQPTDKPPIILVHGAGTNADVWTYWQERLVGAGWPAAALDLRGHGASAPVDLSRTSIWDYVADVEAVAAQFGRPPVVAGWSMGGQIAITAASRGGFSGCVAMDPDPPASAIDETVELEYGVCTPEEIGYDLDGDLDLLPAMDDLTRQERSHAKGCLCAESLLVPGERRRGIPISRMPCPLLEIIGGLDAYYPTEPSYHGIGLADRQILAEEASHWGLVLNGRVLPGLLVQVLAWLEASVGTETDEGGEQVKGR